MTIWNRLKYLWPARRRREEREMREELESLTAIASKSRRKGTRQPHARDGGRSCNLGLDVA